MNIIILKKRPVWLGVSISGHQTITLAKRLIVDVSAVILLPSSVQYDYINTNM